MRRTHNCDARRLVCLATKPATNLLTELSTKAVGRMLVRSSSAVRGPRGDGAVSADVAEGLWYRPAHRATTAAPR